MLRNLFDIHCVTALAGRVLQRLRLLLTPRESIEARDALARFEDEGGAVAPRPALTPLILTTRSDK